MIFLTQDAENFDQRLAIGLSKIGIDGQGADKFRQPFTVRYREIGFLNFKIDLRVDEDDRGVGVGARGSRRQSASPFSRWLSWVDRAGGPAKMRRISAISTCPWRSLPR